MESDVNNRICSLQGMASSHTRKGFNVSQVDDAWTMIHSIREKCEEFLDVVYPEGQEESTEVLETISIQAFDLGVHAIGLHAVMHRVVEDRG